MFRSLLSLALLSAVIAPAVAQTTTDCDPLKVVCPPNIALGMTNLFNFSDKAIDTDTVWNVTNGKIASGSGGVGFTITGKKQAPTVKSNFYFFFGSASVVMRASQGNGIVSSIMLLSDDRDEIDWEWLGGNNTHVQTNYFGKGNDEKHENSMWIAVDDPLNKFHNYTVNWTKEKIDWMIDDKVVRTVTYGNSQGKGAFYPQTPMALHVGNWDGGSSDSLGTRQWALQLKGEKSDGTTDMSGAPFTQTVSQIRIADSQVNATEYTYGDKTGSWQSVKIANKGQSVVAAKITAPPPETPTEKFNKLSTGAKIAIFASAGGVAIILACLFAFFCIRQRRAGRLERAAEDAKWEKGNAELMSYRRQMEAGRFAHGGGGYQRM